MLANFISITTNMARFWMHFALSSYSASMPPLSLPCVYVYTFQFFDCAKQQLQFTLNIIYTRMKWVPGFGWWLHKINFVRCKSVCAQKCGNVFAVRSAISTWDAAFFPLHIFTWDAVLTYHIFDVRSTNVTALCNVLDFELGDWKSDCFETATRTNKRVSCTASGIKHNKNRLFFMIMGFTQSV